MATSSTTVAPASIVIERHSLEHIRLDYVDGLRALAALYVVAHHCWLEIWPTGTPGGILVYATGWLAYGHFAVSLFIVLSGFCLTLPVVRRGGCLTGGALEFYLRRARRILPPYYFALAFSLLLIWLLVGHKTGTHWDMSVPITWQDVVVCIVLLQDVLGNGKVNHAFWSIAVECRIYLLFPALVALRRAVGTPRTGLMVVLVPTLASWFLWVVPSGQKVFAAYPLLDSGFFGFAPSYITLFGLGMLAASIACSRSARAIWVRTHIPWSVLALVCSIPAIIAFRAWPNYPYWSDMAYGIVDLNLGMVALCTLVAGSRSGPSTLGAVFGWRPLATIGTFSYSVYLIHAPLIQVVWQYLVHPMNLGSVASFVLLIVVGFPLILTIAYVFFGMCERPFMPKHGGKRVGLWPFRGSGVGDIVGAKSA